MATNQLYQQKLMVDNLRDMFSGSFDDDIIESILIQREWNVDRALDDLMVLSQNTFNIPIENFDGDEENQMAEFSEFVNDGFEGACSNLPLAEIQNFYPVVDQGTVFVSEDGNDEYMRNESEDDIIVLGQEEYCLPAGSESEEEAPAVIADANAPSSITQPDLGCPKFSYADAAKPVAPPATPVTRVKPPAILKQGYTSYDQIKRTRDSLERVKLFVKEGFKIMVLLRGCPGSGKSHLARKVIEECGIKNNVYQHVHSTDNYFSLNIAGLYMFDYEKLSEAHRWNEVNVLHVAREGLTPIVIDNTHTQMWEMKAYVKIAVHAGYEIEVMEPDTPWAFTLMELIAKNQHDVSPTAINKMLDRYEHNISALSLLKSFGLDYDFDKKPPQMGIRQLTKPNLVGVFENIYHTIEVLGKNKAKIKATTNRPTKEEKKLRKAAKKARKRENKLKKMIEEVRREDSESDNEDNDSNDSCIRDGNEETIKAFLSTDLEEKGSDLGVQDDGGSSENSWTTVDTRDDYDDNNSSDDEDESNSVADSSASSSSSDEACSVTPSNQSTPKNSVRSVNKFPGLKKKGPKGVNVKNTDSTDSKVVTSKSKVTDEISDQLYDLAPNGSRPRLKCFENLRTGDDSSSEHSKDSTFENIAPKLDELDVESERLVESHQMTDDLDTSNDLFVDLNECTSPPATDDDIFLNVADDEPYQTGLTSSKILADLEPSMSDSMQSDDTLSNSEVAEHADSITGAPNNPSKCEWVGLENCVNLPSNVRIEKGVEISNLYLSSGEKSSDLFEPEKKLKISDVIPSCLINEVVESGADVPLDEQLKETVSTPTVNKWTPDWWAYEGPPELYKNIDSSAVPKTDEHSNVLLDIVENVGDVVLDVAVEKTHSLAANIDEPPVEVADTFENTEEVQVHPELPEEPSVKTSNEISGDLSAEAENDADDTLSEKIAETSPEPEVEIDQSEHLLANAKVISDAIPANPKKGTSLTSTIRIWLSSNPLTEVKNNAGVLTFNEQPKKTSFSSAIKNWVSGSSRNEVKSCEDVPDGLLVAANLTASTPIFDNQCKPSTSPASKNLADDSPSRLKLESKSPIRVVKNKLCNVETEICNEADILQTMLRQEMQSKKRNDNDVNVDDVNVANKFDRDAEGGGAAGTNVVKNIFDGPYEDVNLFGEWNHVEKNQAEHSAVENEADSENSDGASNSSSSDEMRTITDVHNSVNRFVNNDINRDAVVERKKPDVNHEAVNRQLKNSNMTASTLADDGSEMSWIIDSNTPDLNTLKERILINSLDKVFGPSNLEFDAVTTPADSSADSKPTNKATLSSGFQMIENKLRTEAGSHEEGTSMLESNTAADEQDVSFWNQWIRGENWDEKPAPEVPTVDKIESKPPRRIQDSPPLSAGKCNLKNSDSNSCWLVNDIKSCIDMEKNNKLPKTSNFLSSGDPFLQAKELREFVDDHKPVTARKMENRSSNFDFLDERTDESKNLQRLSSEFSDVLLGRCKHSDIESTFFSKWDQPSGGELKSLNFTDSVLRTSPNKKQQQESQQRESPTALPVEKPVNNVDDLSRWKFSSHVDYSMNSSNFWPKSTSKAVPAIEKEFSLDEEKFEPKQKPSEVGNFFIPPEVLNLGLNKATNTGSKDVKGCVRFVQGRRREINGRDADANDYDLSLIEAHYKSDKSTMTDGSTYTVKAKPNPEDLSNMFPHEMADAIMDLYEKCNGNMDWIIEILMEDGYSPSDDQLEYLSSLQNVVEYRESVDASPMKEKMSFERRKHRRGHRGRKNESRQNIALKSKRLDNVQSKLNVSPDNFVNDIVSDSNQTVDNTKEFKEENLLGTIMYEDTFDDSAECVDLFIDWTTVSQLIKYFGNPTVYPIQDYQPVIKLPVSLARHLHAHLIESVIDQAEKNENLMDQLNFEMNADPSVELSFRELTQKDLADVENSIPVPEAEPVVRREDSFAAAFSLNLLRKAFPTMDYSFVKNTFRSQNFNYFKTKSILSQYKDEIPVINLKEAPPVGAAEDESDEAYLKDDEVQLFDSSVIKSSSREEILSQVQTFRDEAAVYFVQWKQCHEKLKTALRDKKFGVASHCREVMEEFKQKYERCNALAASLLVTSCCFQNDNIIDLHFFKVVEALRALDIFLDHHISRLVSSGRQKAVLYIITGRGSRSVDGVSHLQPPIKHRLKQRDIEFCIEATNTGLVKAVIRKTSVLSQNL